MKTYVLRAFGDGQIPPGTTLGRELLVRADDGTLASLGGDAAGVVVPAQVLMADGLATPLKDALTQASLAVAQQQGAFGDALYAALAAGEMGKLLDEIPADARVLLDLAPALVPVPWELMRRASARLFTDAAQPWARGSTAEPKRMLGRRGNDATLPLRVLVVIGSEPGDQNVLGDEELRHLEDALHCCQARLIVRVLMRPRADEITAALRELEPHVFHFIGHGAMVGGLPVLRVWSAATGKNDDWDGDRIREAFKGARLPRLVFVNACDTAQGVSAWDIAGTFLELGVDSVIAMQAQIRGGAAQLLSRKFFEALAAGSPIDVALATARNTLAVNGAAAERSNWPIARLVMRGDPDRALPAMPPIANVLRAWAATPDFVARWPQRAQAWSGLDQLHGGRRLVVFEGAAEAGKSQLVRIIAEMWTDTRDGIAAYVDLGGPNTTSMTHVRDRLAPLLAGAGLARAAVDAVDCGAEAIALGTALEAALEQAAGDKRLLVILDGLDKWQPDVVRDVLIDGFALRFAAPSDTSRVRLVVALRDDLARQIAWPDGITPIKVGNFPRSDWTRGAALFIRRQVELMPEAKRAAYITVARTMAFLGDDDEPTQDEDKFKAAVLAMIRVYRVLFAGSPA